MVFFVKLVHTEEKTGRDELMLFPTKDGESAKFRMKKWLKENDQLENVASNTTDPRLHPCK